MNTEELVRAIDEYRKVIKNAEGDVLIELTYHVIQIRNHLTTIEVALKILIDREVRGAK